MVSTRNPTVPASIEVLNDRLRREWSEAQFQREVLTQASGRGWMAHHTRPALRQSGGYSTPIQGHPGYPDLTLTRYGSIVIVELKDEKNNPTADQCRWLTAATGIVDPAGWNSRETVPTHQAIWLPAIGDTSDRPRCHYVGVWRPRHWTHILAVLT